MFNQKKNVSAIFIAVLLLNLFFGVPTGLPSAFAATSIGNNITTDGTVTVNAPGQLTINGLLQYTTGAAANLFLKSSDAAGNAVWAGELDPVFLLSAASGIVAGDITNWNTAYGWGNHASAGYLTSYTETDPIYSGDPAAGIVAGDITNWNTAYGWGNHASAGYLTSYTETDPIFGASPANGILGTDITNWNTAYGWGNHASAGYLTSYTETDPNAVLKSTFTTDGDLVYRNGGVVTRLGAGSNGQVLTISGGVPSWQNAASGFSDPMTTRGDIIYRNSTNTTTRLGRGTSGQVLRSDGTDIAWQTLSGSDVGLGNVENTALSTWAGSTNITTLGTIGTGTWNANTIGTTKGGTGLTSYTAGDLLYASASNVLSVLGVGSNGQCLVVSGGVPSWGSCSSGTGDITDVGSMTSGAAFADSTADDDWLGLGSGAGRIEFDDQTNDEINFLAAMIGIGTQTPLANSLLHIYRSDTQVVPALVLEQASTGDSSMKYLRGTQNITTGVDQNDNDNFKISNATTLTGTTNTMMRIHTEAGSEGIVDFNHQSRVRAYRNAALSPAQGAWSKLTFDAENWDEKSEFSGGTFTALEEGYYQVNARYRITIGGNPGGNSYLGIAIYKNGAAYSYGNRLALSNDAGNRDIPPNNSPNVSDIVYLTAGQTIEIYLWNGSNQAEAITTGSAETYVSIHKLS